MAAPSGCCHHFLIVRNKSYRLIEFGDGGGTDCFGRGRALRELEETLRELPREEVERTWIRGKHGLVS